MTDRFTIVAKLREIATLLELSGGNKFKVRAYQRGAKALEAAKLPVETLVEEKRLAELPGVGTALALQIEEIYRTGSSELLASLKKGMPSGVLELSQVAGVGLHVLETLQAQLGIATVDDLEAAARDGRLREVKGFGPAKEKKILAAIGKYRTKAPPIRLSDGVRLAESLAADLGRVKGVVAVDLAGSVRRGLELSRSLDLVVTTDDPEAVRRHARFGSIESENERECRLRLADGTRVTLAFARPADRAVTLVNATGSEAHVARLTAIARERAVSLEGIGEERELYTRLGLGYVPPELREDEGEIEEAAGGDIELVTREDIRGYVHCHSTWSDGRHSIEEMARAAEERGADFITITDHSKTAFYAGGLDVERLKQQWDEIDEVQERVKIRILKGTEADILADGAIDWPDAILERLDVLIVSIHNRYKQDENAMTERVLRAMRWPGFKIWGHPLGRLVPSRPPIPLRVEEVLDAMAEAGNAVVEISGDPYRMDLEPRWVRAARERGLSFVLSVDAHSTGNLDFLPTAVTLARRGGVRKDEVLNARSTAAFLRGLS